MCSNTEVSHAHNRLKKRRGDDNPHSSSREERWSAVTSAQFIPKKITRSRKSAEASQNEISSNLDDVTFLRLPEVKAITGLSKSSLYALIREKSFPAPVRLGARAVAWVRSEVRQWAAERVRASRSAA
jgi:prophage regulatory protein